MKTCAVCGEKMSAWVELSDGGGKAVFVHEDCEWQYVPDEA